MTNTDKKRTFFLPPVVLLFSILLSLALDRLVPIAEFGSREGKIVGVVVLVLGLAVNLFCAWAFRRRETTIIPFHESTYLITGGLYRYSRNPIYLSMVVVLIGIAIALGSASPWVVPPLFMVIISKRFIQKEEVMLEETFGEEYLAYCDRVRRWL